MEDSPERITVTKKQKFFIGEVSSERGLIGAIEEEKIFGQQILGRIEKRITGSRKGTPAKDLCDNIQHVLGLNLGNQFSVRQSQNPPVHRVLIDSDSAIGGHINVEFLVNPDMNELRIIVSCDNAHPSDVENVMQSVNDVLHNATQFHEGWGTQPSLL